MPLGSIIMQCKESSLPGIYYLPELGWAKHRTPYVQKDEMPENCISTEQSKNSVNLLGLPRRSSTPSAFFKKTHTERPTLSLSFPNCAYSPRTTVLSPFLQRSPPRSPHTISSHCRAANPQIWTFHVNGARPALCGPQDECFAAMNKLLMGP